MGQLGNFKLSRFISFELLINSDGSTAAVPFDLYLMKAGKGVKQYGKKFNQSVQKVYSSAHLCI